MQTRSTRLSALWASACLTLGLVLGLAVVQIGCASNSSSYDHPAPSISEFTTGTKASPTAPFIPTPSGSTLSIPQGGSAWFRANFGVKDGSAVLTPGNLPVTSNVPFPVTNIAATTTYTLTVTSGDGQKATATATVTVLASPAGLTYTNEDATYYAGVKIADNTVATVTGAAPITYAVNKPLPNGLQLSTTTGAITGTPAVQTPQDTYTITASNSVGSTTRDVKIAVAATPLTFTASPAAITVGQSTTLSWDAASIAGVFSAVAITANPADATLPATFTLAGTANVSPLVTTTYTLSATPVGGGAAVTKTADVTVGAAPVHFTSFTATPSSVVLGNTSNLAWSYTGTALDLTLDGASVLGSLGQTVTPFGRQTYTLAGSNLVGGDTATVKVGAKALYHVAGSFGSGRGNVDGGLDPNGFSKARFYRPNSITWDEKANDGSMIVCDYSSNLVRRIAADRTVTTIAGTPGVAGTATTNADVNTLYQPRNTAVDPVTGDVYLGGEGYTTKRLLKLTPNGDGTYTPSLVAGFTINTNALVIDSNRMMYFVEYNASTGNLYKMDLTSGAPTPVLMANLAPTVTAATALAKDFNGGRRLLYLVGSSKIFKIDITNEANPVATLIAGTGTAGFADSLTAATGTVNAPQGVAVDTAGNVYIADRNNFAVRMIPAGGEWSGALLTIAGATGTAGEGYGSAAITLSANPTLPSSAAKTLSNAYYVAIQGDGTAGTKIYVADAAATFDNQAIRIITVSGTTSGGFPSAGTTYTLDDPAKPAGYAYAGAPRVSGNADGVGAFAKFTFGTGSGANLATLPDGSLTFAADTGNNLVRAIAADGTVTTLKDATATNIAFLAPKSVAVQVNPTTKALVALFVGDTGTTKKLRKFTPNGDGTFTEATFAVSGGTYPVAPNHLGLAVDSVGGFVYASDATAAKVFKIDATTGASSDFVAATGTNPMGLALAGDGTLWLAVTGAHQVKSYDTTGTLALTVGTGTAGYADGAATTASLTAPTGIAVDTHGFAYVNNYATSQTATTNGIRAISTATGAVTTLLGFATSTTTPTFYGLKPGLLLPDNLGTTGAQSMNGGVLYAPQGLTINQDGDLLVSTPQSVYKVVAPANQ
jgi:hypothetical protein